MLIDLILLGKQIETNKLNKEDESITIFTNRVDLKNEDPAKNQVRNENANAKGNVTYTAKAEQYRRAWVNFF